MESLGFEDADGVETSLEKLLATESVLDDFSVSAREFAATGEGVGRAAVVVAGDFEVEVVAAECAEGVAGISDGADLLGFPDSVAGLDVDAVEVGVGRVEVVSGEEKFNFDDVAVAVLSAGESHDSLGDGKKWCPLGAGDVDSRVGAGSLVS